MPEYSSEMVARNLKIERTKRGWSQEDLAKKSGVSVNSIARYESKATMPKLENILKLARAFGCSIDSIVGLNQVRHSF